MAITNLLEETIEVILKNGTTVHDVEKVLYTAYTKVVGCSWRHPIEFQTSWEGFAQQAVNFNYENDYGTIEVNTTLRIIGTTWTMERHTYEGSEWWSFFNDGAHRIERLPDIRDLKED